MNRRAGVPVAYPAGTCSLTGVPLAPCGVPGASARLRDDADIGPRRRPTLGIPLPGFVVGDGPGDDHILALLPVHRRCDLVAGGELDRVDDAQHLVEVAAPSLRTSSATD